MPLLWFNAGISEEARQALAKLFRKLARYPFTPPRDDFKPITGKFKLEDREEIAKIMTETRRHFE